MPRSILDTSSHYADYLTLGSRLRCTELSVVTSVTYQSEHLVGESPDDYLFTTR